MEEEAAPEAKLVTSREFVPAGQNWCDWLSTPSLGQNDNKKMRQLEEKIQILTKNLQDLQSTLKTSRGGSTGGGGGGGRNPADAAQPEMKETIHNIQTKLDQLDSRTQVGAPSEGLLIPAGSPPLCSWRSTSSAPQTPPSPVQAHDKTLVSINNHLVNGNGGVPPGGGVSGGRLSLQKEEILQELERRVSLSCSSCQVSEEGAHGCCACVSFHVGSSSSVCRLCSGSSRRTRRGSQPWRSS